MNIHAAPGSTRTRLFLMLRLLLALAILLPVHTRARAAGPWYVSTTGSDANTCAEPALPCRTINAAIALAEPGETIHIAQGTYTGTGREVVLIDRDITLLGGWDELFTAQAGRSTIDAELSRRGVTIDTGITAAADRLLIQNGFLIEFDGGGIYNLGTLALSNSVIQNNFAHSQGGGVYSVGSLSLDHDIVRNNTSESMGGGIYSEGPLTINATTLSGNIVGQDLRSGGGGGGAIYSYGPLIINNSTLSRNRILGTFAGSAIYKNIGEAVINNSTISGNRGFADAIHNESISLTVNNSTITDNVGGIETDRGSVTLLNTILAGNFVNGLQDCMGRILSRGHNLIGNTKDCVFVRAPGDQVGTAAAPIDPRLMPLANNGGPTLTHALRTGSRALETGSPATPGSGGDACLPLDQRGVARPIGGACEIGAWEADRPLVAWIKPADPNPTSSGRVRFSVRFTQRVTGVDLVAPFDDFALAAGGVTGTSIIGASGLGLNYTVTVKTGSGNGTLGLNLIDRDTIRNALGAPLGGPGPGNGSLAGRLYQVRKIPVPLFPKTTVWSPPHYAWSPIPRATQYVYELWKGSTRIYAKTALPASCDRTCTATPAYAPPAAGYQWRVRASASGIWQPFSPFQSFTILAPHTGYWRGGFLDFYVADSPPRVASFSIYIRVDSCGDYKITHAQALPVVNGKFSFSGPFYADGTFARTLTSASGKLGLSSYYIPGCGAVSGGPFAWSATWSDSGQPGAGDSIELVPLPGPEGTFPGPLTIEPIQP